MTNPTTPDAAAGKPSDRRPLQTRSWPVFIRSAATLNRLGISPNAISVASMILAAAGAAGLIATATVPSHGWVRVGWFVGLIGIQGRLIANLFDGMVAVEGRRASAVGPLFNEVPDRISDPLLLVAAGYAAGGEPTWGWAAAVISLLVAYVRAIGASVGAGQLYNGPMAKQHRMAILSLVCVAGMLVPGFEVMGWALVLIVIGGLITTWRRLSRIAAHLRASESNHV